MKYYMIQKQYGFILHKSCSYNDDTVSVKKKYDYDYLSVKMTIIFNNAFILTSKFHATYKQFNCYHSNISFHTNISFSDVHCTAERLHIMHQFYTLICKSVTRN
jgi:hypothetical protein